MTKIIAEFCQNHNGNFDNVLNMIEAAAASGATHAKIQTIFANNLTFRPQFEQGLVQKDKIKSIKRPYKEEFDRLKKLELSYDQMRDFVRVCRKYNIEPLTTCFARCDAKLIKEAGFKTIKVASYDCASFTLLRELKELFSEIIVSTGATYDEEIRKTSEILDGSNFSFLHCVTIYPTPLEEMHLARINFLKNFTDNIGLSDHSLVSRDGVLASKVAIYLGAKIIERHFTILSPEETRDGPVSISKEQLKDLVTFSKLTNKEQKQIIKKEYPEWEVMIGSEKRNLSDSELLNRDYYRGRFATPRKKSNNGLNMIFNWEEIEF